MTNLSFFPIAWQGCIFSLCHVEFIGFSKKKIFIKILSVFKLKSLASELVHPVKLTPYTYSIYKLKENRMIITSQGL